MCQSDIKFIIKSMSSAYKIIISTLFFGFISSQELPFEDTSIKVDFKVWSGSDISIKEIDLGTIKGPMQVIDSGYKFTEHMIYLDNERTVYVDIDISAYSEGIRCFLIDAEDGDIIGPFYVSNNFNKKNIRLGPIQSNQFVLQIKSPMDSFHSQINISSIFDLNNFDLEISDNIGYIPIDISRESPKVLVTGFWPPTNEMIRHFSQNQELNLEGWQGCLLYTSDAADE